MACIVENIKKGKVRDITELAEMLVIETTNRISAFDSVLGGTVPFKGEILQTISNKYMDLLENDVPNHLVTRNPKVLKELGFKGDGSAVLVKKAIMLPIEFIVRGYYIPTSKSWDSYKENCTIQGIELPAGLKESEKLPEPIFTPTTKGEKDYPITFEEMVSILDKFHNGISDLGECGWDSSKVAEELRSLSLKLYKKAAEYALSKGIILADTKLEFGIFLDYNNYQIVLCDEAFTPDSSRYWDLSEYEVGKPQNSIDKQYLRDYLKNELKWSGIKDGPVPQLSKDVLINVTKIYNEILLRLFDVDICGDILAENLPAEELYEILMEANLADSIL